jgi:hypothetical protein
MEKLFILSLLCLSLKCPDIVVQDVSKEQSIENYYKNVNRAEYQILEDNLTAADSFYYRAFLCGSAFNKDIFNAVIVKTKLGTNSSSTEINDHLLRRLTDSNKERLLTYLYTSKGLGKERDSIVRILEMFQPIREKAFEDILERDQTIRHSPVCKGIKYSSIGCEQEKKRIDSSNSRKIIELIKANDFIYTGNTQFIIYIVALHNSEWGNYELHEVLKKLVINGNFDSRVYARLMDQIPKKDQKIYFGTNKHLIINDSYYYLDTLNSLKRVRIDSIRSQYYLKPYAEDERLRLWELKNNPPYQFNHCYKMNINKKTVDVTMRQILENNPTGRFIEFKE